MKKRTLEPGLLTVFTIFTSLRLTFVILATIARTARPQGDIRLVELLEPALLLGILIWLALRTQYQHVLLPVALLMAGLGPLGSQAELLSDDTTTWLPIESILTLQTWGSMIVLLLPVVIIAWQYRFEHVVVFSAGITMLNTASIVMVVNIAALDSVLVTSSLIFRMLTFLVIGWLVARMMTVQRAQRDAWKEANRRLTHHAATLEQLAITRERNRLARELHDTLAHTLSAVAVQLEAVNALWDAKPDQARTRLQKSIAVTRSGLTETRRVLQDLRASPLEDLGLALAVRHLAESTASRGGLALDLHIAGQLGNISPDIEQAVYRITQEALTNVINHANATNLTVQLGLFENRLTLTVSDDGAGFDRAASPSARRFGMQGMYERAEMIGGTLKVESHPGGGTIVMLSIEVET